VLHLRVCGFFDICPNIVAHLLYDSFVNLMKGMSKRDSQMQQQKVLNILDFCMNVKVIITGKARRDIYTTFVGRVCVHLFNNAEALASTTWRKKCSSRTLFKFYLNKYGFGGGGQAASGSNRGSSEK
jgi:hypothetical protein